MRLGPRPILTDEQLLKLRGRASPLSTYGQAQFDKYPELVQGLKDAARQGDKASYAAFDRELQELRRTLEWLASRSPA